MLKKVLLYFVFLLSGVMFAQTGGRYTYQFLNLVSSPRQAALGGRIITNYDYDVTQPLTNPASLNEQMNHQLGLNYVNYLADVNYGSAAYAFPLNNTIGMVHGGVTYINYGNFDGRNEFGDSTGTFTGNEVAISLGYARDLPWSGFHAGINVKAISSVLAEYNSFGGAIDLGMVYLHEASNLHTALVIRNIGFQFSTYAGEQENLPLEIALGISKKLQRVPIRWHITFENLQDWNLAFANPARTQETLDGQETTERITFVKEFLRHTIIGAELFPDKGFNLRLGYNFRRGEELRIAEQRNFSGLSLGFGIRIQKVRFHYTYVRYSSATNTSLFGLMIKLM